MKTNKLIIKNKLKEFKTIENNGGFRIVGKVIKELETEDSDNELLKQINMHTRKELKMEDVYIFPMILCDNDVDRDLERFSVDSLTQLSPMFIGKTVLFDHDHKAKNQIARIFKTQVETFPDKLNAINEPYYRLKAYAYIFNHPIYDSIIKSIDAGILKEISVGVSMGLQKCSVCGENYWECKHFRGEYYNGNIAHVILESPNEAYEASFVAIPAQANAGVTKKSKCKGDNTMGYLKLLEKYGISQKSYEELEEKFEGIDPYMIAEIIETFGISKNSIKNVFIEEEAAASLIGKKSVTADEFMTEIKKMKEDSKKYKEFIEKEENKAIQNGIKAYGEDFKKEKWEKILKSCTIEEIREQSEEWESIANEILHVGTRLNQPNEEYFNFKNNSHLTNFNF